MKYRTVTPANVFPCSVDFVKGQLRITHAAHDAYIQSLIAAATDWACSFTGRQINLATLQANARYMGVKEFEIERGPVISITKIEYLNTSGVLVTIDPSNYELAKDEYSGRIYLKSDFDFALIDLYREDAIRITFNAGYGDTLSFPEVVKNAVAIKAARLFTSPEDGVDEKATVSENLLKAMRCPIV